MVSIIAAMAENGVIGRDGSLPWEFPEDLKKFREVTMGHAVVMGRRTFESLRGPLQGRRNIVLSHRPGYAPSGAEVARSLPEALEACRGDAFVIGGGTVFAEALPVAGRICLTVIGRPFDGDTFFPAIPEDFEVVSEEPLPGALPAVYRVYLRRERK